MEQMEYRMEEISLGGHGSYAEQIVARLNELGREGWHVTGIDLAGHPSWANRTVPVLLQRVAVAAVPATRQQAAVGAR